MYLSVVMRSYVPKLLLFFLIIQVLQHCSFRSCEGTLGLYGTIPLKTIWSRSPYVMVARWDFYGTIGYGTLDQNFTEP